MIYLLLINYIKFSRSEYHWQISLHPQVNTKLTHKITRLDYII